MFRLLLILAMLGVTTPAYARVQQHRHKHATTHVRVPKKSAGPADRGYAPQPAQLIEKSNSLGSTPTAPVLIRIFKEEQDLEIWRMNQDGLYMLLETYSVCKYAGELGPKKREGDHQSPEGFYGMTTNSLNYNSVRWLSINTGYPNQYDKAHHRTGSAIMIHGGCGSTGCFAIQNGPVQELFTTVRDSLRAGQDKIQIHIFPFRMTEENMIKHADNPNYEFWKELKPGYDKFEENRQDLQVTVVAGKYQIN